MIAEDTVMMHELWIYDDEIDDYLCVTIADPNVVIFDRAAKMMFLEGEAYKTTNISGTFQLDMLADWGKANSVCEALWTAAETAPDTDITITLTAATGAQFQFPIKPEFPTAGGSGIDAQTVDFEFTVSGGAVTETFS